MGSFFFFIESIATALYIFVGVLLVWYMRSLILARRELTVARFSLERELAQRQGGRALTMVLLAVEIGLLVWAISNIAAPAWRAGLPDEDLTNIAQAQRFATSTPSALGEFNPIATTGPGGPDILSTAPPPSTPQGTIIAPGERVGCIRDQAWIDFPANGMLVFEPINVQGTASVEDFAFYRFEIKRDLPDRNFAPIGSDYIQPVVNGPLGQFLPRQYIEGGYRFRLVVFNTDNAPAATCEITIYISLPVPTETPIGGADDAPATPTPDDDGDDSSNGDES